MHKNTLLIGHLSAKEGIYFTYDTKILVLHGLLFAF